MRIASYSGPTGQSYGLIRQNGIVDLASRLGPAFPDLKSLVHDKDMVSRIENASLGCNIDHSIEDISFLPVIPNPGKIICVGLNYLEHRLEGNHAAEFKVPALFVRFANSQTGHNQPLICPRESGDFDYEAELALIIGKPGRRISEADALSHIAGISCYNDASVRDWQLATNQWTAGKNFPSTGSLGPWVVTPDETKPDAHLDIVCRLNGTEMQRSNTELMMANIPQIIAHISTFTALAPGDIIATGTPGGVGLRRNPPVWMKDGDVVEIEIEGVGILRNPVIKER